MKEASKDGLGISAASLEPCTIIKTICFIQFRVHNSDPPFGSS